jgi:hypothetical protein
MEGAEDASEQGGVFRALLEGYEILLQLREVFITLDKELSNCFPIFFADVFHNQATAFFIAAIQKPSRFYGCGCYIGILSRLFQSQELKHFRFTD